MALLEKFYYYYYYYYLYFLSFVHSNGYFSIAELLTHEVASHLVEQILSVLSPDHYSKVLQQLSGQLVAMAMHPTANFVLQVLIAHTCDEAQVSTPVCYTT